MGIAKVKRPENVPSITVVNTPGFTGDGSGLTGIPAAALVANAIGSGQLDVSVLQKSVVTLSTANITGMNGTAVPILAAPGANKYIIVDQILLQMKPGGTQFTSGGVVTFVYHGGSAVHAGSIAASVINSASASMNLLAPISSGLAIPANTGIDVTNATGAFATGNGSAIVVIYYAIVTAG